MGGSVSAPRNRCWKPRQVPSPDIEDTGNVPKDSSPNLCFVQKPVETVACQTESEISQQVVATVVQTEKSDDHELGPTTNIAPIETSQQPITTVSPPTEKSVCLESQTAEAASVDCIGNFNEEMDEEEILKSTFDDISRGKPLISKDDIEFASSLVQDPLITSLKSELSELSQIDYETFKRKIDEIPRARGRRLQWVRSLGLDGEIARLMPVGNLVDGLKGLKEINDESLQKICSQFAGLAYTRIRKELQKLKEGQSIDTKAEEANSKYCLTDGAFKGTFGSLEDFYKGPEAKIGYPNPNLFEGMHREHCLRSNAKRLVTTPNYNVTTCSDWEWRFVVCPENIPHPGFEYPHTPLVKDRSEWSGLDVSGKERSSWKGHGRRIQRPDEMMADCKATMEKARIVREEFLALRLYTGPLYILYNAVLRGYPRDLLEGLDGNRYETTLFVIISGVSKLARITPIPANRLLYRGLGGMLLPDQFWKDTGQGFLGGVELGLMSTTSDRRVAVQYSGLERRRAAIMEISAGRVDIGGSLGFLSQYPGEEEFLMPPLSCLEVVGRPRVEQTARGELIVFPLRVNVNLKSVTVEELMGRRKGLHLAMEKNLREELAQQARASVEEAVAAEIARAAGACAELVRGCKSDARVDAAGCATEQLSERAAATFGAPSLAVSAGQVRFEVEVESLHGMLDVGFAGTNFRAVLHSAAGPAPPHLGEDALSWHVHNSDADGQHAGAFVGRSGRMWILKRGDVIGVALDLAAGSLLVRCEMGWRRMAAPVAPGPVVGSGLFPAWTIRRGGGRIQYNFGARPFKLPPPGPDFVAIAAAAGDGQTAEARALADAVAAVREAKAAAAQLGGRRRRAERELAALSARQLRQVGGRSGAAVLGSPWAADLKEMCTLSPAAAGRSAGRLYFEVEVVGLAAAGPFLVVGVGGTAFLEAAGGPRAARDGPAFDETVWGVGCARGFFRAHGLAGEEQPEEWAPGSWAVGDVVGVACDLDAGRLAVSINGDFSGPLGAAYEEGVRPGPVAGRALHPVVCGVGVQVRCAFGPDLRHAPPDPSYLAEPAAGGAAQVAELQAELEAAAADLAAAEAAMAKVEAAEEVARASLEKATEAALRSAGIEWEAMENEFAAAAARHAALPAASFNDDLAYKRLLNEALDLKGQLLSRQAAVLALRRAGSAEAALRRCAAWPATDFRGDEAALPDGCGYTWRSLLAGCTAPGMRMPLELPGCLLALVWEAVLAAGVAEVRLGLGASGQALRIADACPSLAAAALGLHYGKYAAAVLGLVLGAPAGSLTSLDVRGNDYAAAALGQLAEAVAAAGGVVAFNGQPLPEGAALRGEVCRAIAAGCAGPGVEMAFRGLRVDLERPGLQGAARRRRDDDDDDDDEAGGGPRLSDVLRRRSPPPPAAGGEGGAAGGGGGSDEGAGGDDDVAVSKLDQAEWAFVAARLDAQGVSVLSLRDTYPYLGAAGAARLTGPLRSLERLVGLRLPRSELGDDGAAAVARGLPGLTGLASLVLSGNEIGGAGAAALAGGLTALAGLRALDLGGNALGPGGATALTEALRAAPLLEALVLSETGLKAGGGAAVAAWLAGTAATGLRRLDLSGNDAGPEACAALAGALGRFGGMERLELARNRAGDAAGAALGAALAGLARLTALDLGDNGLGAAACAGLAGALPGLTGLRRLRLADPALRAEDWGVVLGGLGGCTRLARLDEMRVAELDRLTGIPGAFGALVAGGHASLHFGYMFNKPEVDAALLGALLARSAAVLAKADLSHCDLSRNKRAAVVADWLGALPVLASLNLSSNFLERAGAAALAGGLSRLTALTWLDLSENRLGDAGAAALAAPLAALTGLRALLLRNNGLGPDGCVCAAGAAGRLAALEAMDLSANRLAPRGGRGRPAAGGDDESKGADGPAEARAIAQRLAEALAGATALQSLDLRYCELDAAAAAALAETAAELGLPVKMEK